MNGFSVGYQAMPGEPDLFSDIVRDYREHIREVYFAWPGTPSGRAPLASDEETIRQMTDELSYLRSLGIKLNLLLNASCYGPDAVSSSFHARTGELMTRLQGLPGIDAITTMSPVIAEMAKRDFPQIDVRASVNMRLGTVRGMQYAAEFFDSYYVQREFNRDPGRLAELQEWAHGNGKKLYALANSGCLNFCSFQTFHDNVVAHGDEIDNEGASMQVSTLCRSFYARKERRVHFLRGSWIRPEDLAEHRKRFDGGYKLATRMHGNPRLVIDAYATGRHFGNLLDLMEPGFGPSWYPCVLDNRRFPGDWFDRTMACGQQCAGCTYCEAVLEETTAEVAEAEAVTAGLSA